MTDGCLPRSNICAACSPPPPTPPCPCLSPLPPAGMTLGLISDRGRETIMHFAVSITYSVVALGLLSTVGALNTFGRDRVVFYRESASGEWLGKPAAGLLLCFDVPCFGDSNIARLRRCASRLPDCLLCRHRLQSTTHLVVHLLQASTAWRISWRWTRLTTGAQSCGLPSILSCTTALPAPGAASLGWALVCCATLVGAGLGCIAECNPAAAAAAARAIPGFPAEQQCSAGH